MSTPEEPIAEDEEIEVHWIGRFLVLTAISNRLRPGGDLMRSEDYISVFEPLRMDPVEIGSYGVEDDKTWIRSESMGCSYVCESLDYLDAAMQEHDWSTANLAALRESLDDDDDDYDDFDEDDLSSDEELL